MKLSQIKAPAIAGVVKEKSEQLHLKTAASIIHIFRLLIGDR